MSTTLSDTDLLDILNGACLYGCGGGGSIALGRSLLEQLTKAPSHPIMLATPQEMTGADACCVSAGIGSPTAAGSTGFQLGTLALSFDRLAQGRGTGFTHVMPAELGAANSLLPMTVAATNGIPVLDAAGSFRAVPQIMQSTFAIRGLPIGTVVLANDQQHVTFAAGGGPVAVDATIRGIISGGAFTDDAGVALWAMDAAAAQRGSLTGTTEAARQLGAILRTALADGNDPVAAVSAFLGGRVLITGGIAEEQQQSGEATDFGVVVITDSAGQEVRVLSQNENLVAWVSTSTRPAALAPDLIVFMTTDGKPFSNADIEGLPHRTQVAVIIAPVDASMRVPAMVAAFLPLLRSTGYGGVWKGVEDL